MTDMILAMLLTIFLLLVYATIRTCFGDRDRLAELRDFNRERRTRLAPARARSRWHAG